MKRVYSIFLLLAIICSISVKSIAAENIKILINNQPLSTNTPPVIVDGRTLVPLRAIGEAMGCNMKIKVALGVVVSLTAITLNTIPAEIDTKIAQPMFTILNTWMVGEMSDAVFLSGFLAVASIVFSIGIVLGVHKVVKLKV